VRRPLRLAVGGALSTLALASGAAAAQEPTRLPAVVVNAAPERPGPRKVAGVVRDTAAVALDSVEVSITSLQRRVFSKADGTFLFTDVGPGKYEVRARKLGYGPQIREMATRRPTVREVHNFDDLGQRLAWRNTQHSRVYPSRPTNRRPIAKMPMSNTERASFANFAKPCASLVYVWLR
jgi:hypothetical protein